MKALFLLTLSAAAWLASSSTLDGVAAAAPPSAPTSAARFRFGFEDEVICNGLVFDDPKRYRMKCRRAPARAMNCLCNTGSLGAKRFACRCHDPLDGTGALARIIPEVGTVEAQGLREPE